MIATSNDQTNQPIAYCDFFLEGHTFMDYVAICDYMSKRKIYRDVFIAGITIDCLFLGISIALNAFTEVTVLLSSLLAIWMLNYAIALSSKTPLWWWTNATRDHCQSKYKEALGYGYGSYRLRLECRFECTDKDVTFSTQTRKLTVPLDEILWVRRIGNLVVVGLSDWFRSFNVGSSFTYMTSNGAILGAAFLASKLEGMEPEELISFLEVYAKKAKPSKGYSVLWT